MQIESIEIRNYRMLKEMYVDLEDNLSLIIGKNNTGKTSFLSLLKKFLSDNNPAFSFEDFNVEIQKEILELEDTNLEIYEYKPISISLKLNISYNDDDNIADASILLMDLDETNNKLVVLFEYSMPFENYLKLIDEFKQQNKTKISFENYISKYINSYFLLTVKAVEYSNESNSKILPKDAIKNIISLETIEAKREVDNKQGKSKSLSVLAGKYYDSYIDSKNNFPELQEQLIQTDVKLTQIYQQIFESIVKEIIDLSYNPNEAELSIVSTLSERNIFEDNTIVKYKHNDMLLPEDYNGLGYLNLFAMIFNIRIKLDSLLKKHKSNEKPTPINILFIEEPEAHTHPQMQYIFISNIKKLLENQQTNYNNTFNLQTLISTHSSHIVSQCDFSDIKYFFRETDSSVKSRSLKNLYCEIIEADKTNNAERAFRFIKQYVTLNSSELFFADKVILIEGDTERILFKAMMKKYDKTMIEEKNYIPLLSQNISVLEVGAHSYNLAVFLGFLGIKTLIITDLDCARQNKNKKEVKCNYQEATTTTNSSIKKFIKEHNLKEIVKLAKEPIILKFDDKDKQWNLSNYGNLRIVFQTKENNYQARSFEDAFLSINEKFIITHQDDFLSLKNRNSLSEKPIDYYNIAEKCINSKTAFALDLLLFDGEKEVFWEIPKYIKEGLSWL